MQAHLHKYPTMQYCSEDKSNNITMADSDQSSSGINNASLSVSTRFPLLGAAYFLNYFIIGRDYHDYTSPTSTEALRKWCDMCAVAVGQKGLFPLKRNDSCCTRSFGSSLNNAAQSEDHGPLVLLDDLQDGNHRVTSIFIFLFVLIVFTIYLYMLSVHQ